MSKFRNGLISRSRTVPIAVVVFAALVASGAQTPVANAPDPAATLNYIHASWDSLTRSVSDCAALADPKVNGTPVLYFPAEMPIPADVRSLEQKCHARVMNLPKKIVKLGDLMPQALATEGLLYLPNPYVVPGGRFNEMYGWDSYFILLGLEADRHEALAKGIVDNFLFEVEHYGGVLNANRTYYLTRSQPPFLTSMIRMVYEDRASFAATPEGRAEANAWLAHAYEVAEKDHSTWTRPEHKAGVTGLARYYDYGSGPIPEMADASTYYVDVIRALVEHPTPAGNAFLVKGSERPDAAEAARLKLTSCDVNASVLCMKAWFGGYRLTRDYYEGDRAMRESGFDPSDRFGPFSGATHHYAPMCLNSLLYRYERDMAHFAHLLGNPTDAAHWDREANARYAAIQRYLWRPKEGVFADYDFVHARASDYAYITSLYPLWAGAATREEANQIEAKLSLFERPGGLSMSNTNTGLQWDEPYGWAPTNWIAVAGLEAFGFRADAARIAKHFDETVDAGFAADGTIREKYNVVAGNAQVNVSAGYTQNVIGFGWTNAVYLKFREISGEQNAPPN
ncbi:MAG TPA: trehalase family glycosidase [Terracidiphilus sp.]|nr:trehalase family glycosidase [Terracidiphilus sp.]